MQTLNTARLLPPNATQLEVDVDGLFDKSGKIEESVDLLRIAKFESIPDSFIPWLIYEYGLEEVIPWVTDEREAIRTGVSWQRIRGTPKALEIALSWIGFVAEKVEPEEIGRHFFEFQMELGAVPTRDLVENISELSKLSAPLRSRLIRMYHGYDIRRFKLDGSEWGDLLGNYSGVWDNLTGTWLSFGRSGEITVTPANFTSLAITNRVRTYPVALDENEPYVVSNVAMQRERGYKGALEGQHWTGNRWPTDTTANTTSIIIGESHVRSGT